MIATSIFGVAVIAVNVFFVVDTIMTSLADIHWAWYILIAVIALAYFCFVFYLVSVRNSNCLSALRYTYPLISIFFDNYHRRSFQTA